MKLSAILLLPLFSCVLLSCEKNYHCNDGNGQSYHLHHNIYF